MEKTLFIGNGIHRAFESQSISWDDLLKNLTKDEALMSEMPGVENLNLTNPLKPFPFAFEELVQLSIKSSHDSPTRIKLIKERVRHQFDRQLKDGKKTFNRFHEEIMKSRITDVITSNYDYGFEESVEMNFYHSKEKLADYRMERTGNLRRSYTIGNKRVWHMHGELFDSRNRKLNSESDYPEQSILLGYGHYSKNMADLKNYVEGKHESKDYLMSRIARGEKMERSWVDKFFTHDIDIIGFGLGFEEQDVWWVLNFRASKIESNLSRKSSTINNKVRFVIRAHKEHNKDKLEYKDRIKVDKNEAIKEVLKAMKVEILEIKTNSWPEFYDKYLTNHI